MGKTGRKIERALWPNRTDRTSSHEQLAFKAGVVIDWVIVLASFAIRQHGSQKNEISEFRMNQIAVNAHVSESGFDGGRLVGDDPDRVARVLIHFHREAHRRIHRANSSFLELGNDRRADFIDLMSSAGRVISTKPASSAPHSNARRRSRGPSTVSVTGCLSHTRLREERRRTVG